MLLILTHLDGQNVGKSVKMPGTKSSFYHPGTTILYLWCHREKMIKEHFPTHSSSLKKCWPTVFKRKFFQWGGSFIVFSVWTTSVVFSCTLKSDTTTFMNEGMNSSTHLLCWDFWQTLAGVQMSSKTQWVFYRDLDWWPGPQKVQFGEITGYP